MVRCKLLTLIYNHIKAGTVAATRSQQCCEYDSDNRSSNANSINIMANDNHSNDSNSNHIILPCNDSNTSSTTNSDNSTM